MSISITAHVAKPDDTPVTLSITMTVGEWKRLSEQIGEGYPGWKLDQAIRKMARNVAAAHEEKMELEAQ